MNLYDEFFAIIEALEKYDVTYAVIGGIAMAFNEQPRFTKDIDILIKESHLEKAETALGDFIFLSPQIPILFEY